MKLLKEKEFAEAFLHQQDRPNFSKLDGFYIVRTQAGFKQAFKDWGYSILDRLHVHPTSYPSFVVFTSVGLNVYASCVHVNKLKEWLSQE